MMTIIRDAVPALLSTGCRVAAKQEETHLCGHLEKQATIQGTGVE